MKHTIACVGFGWRGRIHLKSFLAFPESYEVTGICDINPDILAKGAEICPTAKQYNDADKMLSELKPDIFCFVTQPKDRIELVKLAAKHKVKGLIFEKPMATSIQEAREIAKICKENNIKAVVSHQQKYLDSMQELKKTIDSGVLGKITKIHAETMGNSSNLGTHFIDYALWAGGNSNVQWCVGHADGRELLHDSHPSPDFIYGLARLENAVRIYFEFGMLKQSYLSHDQFWVDNRLTVYGENGYAWAETDGAFAAQFKGQELIKKQFKVWSDVEDFKDGYSVQIPFAKDFADWMDGKTQDNPCSVAISVHGFEILQAMYVSAIENKRVDLPLADCDLYDADAKFLEVIPEQKKL